TAVNISRRGSKGKIEIEFYSNDDLERVLELLRSREF
ncbi:MAG: chromosome partitioning protein ParB, partial [Gemmatimonadetes bacterium]|nr:chromosome partitioning protein ParB [Gemmatimonadota bacterium]